jgi:ABC-2 type transport system ATP-binding protein
MGTPGELKAHLSHRTRLDLVVSEASGLDPSALAIDLGTDARVRGRRISAWVAADEALRTLEKVIASAGPEGLEDAHLVTPTLEDVYLEIGGYSISEEEEQRS